MKSRIKQMDAKYQRLSIQVDMARQNQRMKHMDAKNEIWTDMDQHGLAWTDKIKNRTYYER